MNWAGNFEPRYPQEFLEHKSRLDMNSEGTLNFLGWWTLETLIFQSFQLLIIAISAVLCVFVSIFGFTSDWYQKQKSLMILKENVNTSFSLSALC